MRVQKGTKREFLQLFQRILMMTIDPINDHKVYVVRKGKNI